MVKKIWIFTVVIILGISAFLVAQETKNKPPKEEISAELKAKIEQLIKDLGAEDWQAREAAQKALEEIGAPAEPFLKEALQNPDPEVKGRAKRLLGRIEAKRSGKIAFVRNKNIWLIEADGQNQSPLTQDHDVWEFRWSPDGKKIAFVSRRPHDLEIYIMDEDGKNQIRLTDNEIYDGQICWAPDNNQIAFASERKETEPAKKIYLMNTDGENETKLTTNNKKQVWESQPAWSPDGKKIAFASTGTFGEFIYLKNVDGKNIERLNKGRAEDCEALCWSPDGAKIAYVATIGAGIPTPHGPSEFIQSIRIIDMGTKTNTELCKEEKSIRIDSFSWSPDGQKIAFVSNRNDNHEIYVVDANGKNQIKLTNGHSLSRSLDGKKIAFASNRDGQDEIYVMDAAGQNQTRLTYGGGTNPAWQPVPKK